MATIKKYNGSTWENTTARKYETKSEIIVPPTTIYADGSNITTYTIKGNTVQNGTPTPSAPIAVQGVGELDSGLYKIPISSAGVTTNIYLGSTRTVRAIGKRTFNGSENWGLHGSLANLFYIDDYQDGYANNTKSGFAISNAFVQNVYNVVAGLSNGQFVYGTPSGTTTKRLLMKNTACATLEDWKSWLAMNPVTVWYVLATPETAAVNEPLMKIGTYADSISNATAIPTTEGANSITVDTTVQPSEFSATWTGWRDASVKVWDGSQWNE